MRFILGLIVSFLMLSAAGASAAGMMDQAFDAGNKYYLAGAYDKAIIEYESIIKSGYQSPELYFNAGNAYFRAGQQRLRLR